MAILQVWIAPAPVGAGAAFVAQLERISDDSSIVMVAILVVFALVHSGLAAARPWGKHWRRDRHCPGWPNDLSHLCSCIGDGTSLLGSVRLINGCLGYRLTKQALTSLPCIFCDDIIHMTRLPFQ